MDFATVSSIILFIISIITFVSGLITKAQNDGKVLARIEQIQTDISEIKIELKGKSQDIEKQKIITENQECRIKNLEEKNDKLELRLSRLEVNNNDGR